VSLDGRYLAIIDAGEPPPGARLHGYAMTLTVLDLQIGGETIVESGPLAAVLGWSATGQLIYVRPNPDGGSDGGDSTYLLTAYEPAAGVAKLLSPDPVRLTSFGPNVWSVDHSALVWMRAGQPDRTQGPLVRYTFGPQPEVDRLGEWGGQPALSADGGQVAYMTTVTGGPQTGMSEIKVLDLTTARMRHLAFSSNGAQASPATFSVPQWSPDGRQLAWSASPAGQVQTVAASGGAVRIWTTGGQPIALKGFSPDGRYLLAEAGGGPDPLAQGVQNYLSLKQFWLFDELAETVSPPQSFWAYSTLWLPGAHRLLAAGPAGVTSFDPATGEYVWLGDWQRCQLRR
ncbi:MAG: hypothetical protein ABI847_08250, partial [Anaerolineales bacterium]